MGNEKFNGLLDLLLKTVVQPPGESLFGFEWKSMQFSVRVVFSMTIHKAQGQTSKKYVYGFMNLALAMECHMLLLRELAIMFYQSALLEYILGCSIVFDPFVARFTKKF